MRPQPEEGDGEGSPAKRARRRGAGAAALVVAAIASLVLLVPAGAGAQSKHLPKPSPTPDPALAEIAALAADIKSLHDDVSGIRGELVAIGARLDEINAGETAIKNVVEPMREEVRGLYVETSNVRSEIARLEETYTANTDALAKSRYVLTLLLVATAVLQLVVLLVLLRSR